MLEKQKNIMKAAKFSKIRKWLGKLSICIFLYDQRFSAHTILNGFQNIWNIMGKINTEKSKENLKCLEKIQSEIGLVPNIHGFYRVLEKN